MRHYKRRSSWVEPACIVVVFAVFTLSGCLWGLAVRTPHPDINSIAVLPGALHVETPTVQRAGLESPTRVEINGTAEGLINYLFSTPDEPGKVIDFYKNLMLKQYGFQHWTQETRGDGAQVLSLDRGTIKRYINGLGGQDVEHVTITAIPGGGENGQTLVEVHRDTTVFTGPPQP